MEILRQTFEQQLAAALPGVDITLERPRSGELGDLAFPCFRAAKQRRKDRDQRGDDHDAGRVVFGET